MNIAIIGANSAIAEAYAKYCASQYKANFFLVARDINRLQILADDLTVRGAGEVECLAQDFAEVDNGQNLLEKYQQAFTSLDVLLVAHGILPDQEKAKADAEYLQHVLQVNSTSTLTQLTVFANYLAQQGKGKIAVISSVAGDRGRPSNYVYGASKAIVSTFLQGLRARLAKNNVHVLTVKPGFVKSPMTAHLNGSGPMWAEPETIAKGIDNALAKNKNTVYLPGFWRLIMAIITRIPEPIFKKLSL